ncbi:MAG: hypothetical protein PHU01_15280, partial [Desulfuromonadaceae bacterium]|nr:hypothetical protein [Desulfuromonadaceae bacterium]
MAETSVTSTASVKRTVTNDLLIGIVFGLAGFAVNLFKLELYFNVDFLFGSILTMFAIMRFGLTTGIVAAFIAALCTWYHWGQPWAVVIFTVEAIFTALLIRRKVNSVFTNLIYWFSCGTLLVLLFYHFIMKFPLDTTILIALKQGINGVANTLAAS